MKATGLLCTVKNFDPLDGCRYCLDKLFSTERSVETNLYDTDLLTLCCKIINGLFDSIIYGAHSDDDGLCIRGTIIVEELVVCSCLRIDLVHILLNYSGKVIVCAVAGLSCLEEDVGVLSRAHLTGMIGIQCICLEGLDRILVDKISKILIRPYFYLLNLVGSTETVKEIDEGKSALNSCAVCNGSEVHNLLN